MAVDANERVEGEILRAFAVPDDAMHKVEEVCLMAVYQGAERLGIAIEVAFHQMTVIERVRRRRDGGHNDFRNCTRSVRSCGLRCRFSTRT